MTDLLEYIHFEKQEGNLCAQHCLNNLLQGDYWNALELGKIASELDSLEILHGNSSSQDIIENSINFDDGRNRSFNMDDSGFFSVQVIERALQIYGLRLVRWASEEVRNSNGIEKPENELAFILNLDSHWYTLRKFGNSSQRWYNLNSSLQNPTWISPTYLGMQLVDCESEGYSVFSVRPIDENNLNPLPTCQGDDIAMTFPIDQNKKRNEDEDLEKQMLEAAMRESLQTVEIGENSKNSKIIKNHIKSEDFNHIMDQDDELQQAIKASLVDVKSENLQEILQENKEKCVQISPEENEDMTAEVSPEEMRLRRLARFSK